MNIAGISLSDAQGQIFLQNDPVPGRAAVDVAMLQALLAQSGYAGCAVSQDALARAARDCNTLQTSFMVQVAELIDAVVEVHIAPDEMAAHISFMPAQGGKAATVADVLYALTDARVVLGIDQAAVAKACLAGQANMVLVASGTLPEAGHDTTFETLLAQVADRAPKVGADGLIDYREHGGINLVKPGTPLLRRIPPTPGVAGHTVKGRELAPCAGLDVPFSAKMVGVELASSDSNLLQAAVAGQPVLIENGAEVEPVVRVPEVNLSTGNIYFEGTVQVDGDVVQGMKIKASGDIIVGGTVDGGLLEAGGDVQVAFGIISQAQVKAVGAVRARFAENSTISAGTVIALNEMALQCQLESLNQIIIGDKAPQRGRLLGGHTTAMMLLRVPLLGCSKSGVTRVTVGANAVVEAQFQALQARMEVEKAAEENLEKLIKQLTASGDPKGMLERVKASWKQAVQVWSRSLAERTELQKQIDRMLLAKVQVGVAVDGSVDMAFGKKTASVRSEFGKGAICIHPEAGVAFVDSVGGVTRLM